MRQADEFVRALRLSCGSGFRSPRSCRTGDSEVAGLDFFSMTFNVQPFGFFFPFKKKMIPLSTC